LFCFLGSSLFNCSRTTVTATWKLRGLPWLAASIRLSQEAFKLLYLSEISEEGNSCQEKSWDWVRESNKDDDLTPYQRLQAHAAFAFGIATGGDVPQVVL
jgi:hypothetical protein